MTEIADWGTPSWLPPRVRQEQLAEEGRERAEAKRAAAEREARIEASRQRALTQAAEEARQRGEVLDVMALARGEVRARSVQDVFAEAVRGAEADDRRDALRSQRQGTGELAHIHVAEPQILTAPAARSAVGREIFNRSRKWRDYQSKKKAAEDARKAIAAGLDHGLVEGVSLRSAEDDDPLIVLPGPRRRGDIFPGDDGLRFRR